MTRPALLCAAAALVQGCAAIPVVVAMGAMGAIPGGATSDRAAQLVAAEARPAAAGPDDSGGADALPRLAALPPQTLAPGACALFLFSRGEAPQFVAMADVEGETLLLGLDGAAQTLRAAAAPDASNEGFEQTYRGAHAGRALEARVNARWGEVLPQGRRAPDSSLRLAAADGAARVMPLSGLMACEAAAEE